MILVGNLVILSKILNMMILLIIFDYFFKN